MWSYLIVTKKEDKSHEDLTRRPTNTPDLGKLDNREGGNCVSCLPYNKVLLSPAVGSFSPTPTAFVCLGSLFFPSSLLLGGLVCLFLKKIFLHPFGLKFYFWTRATSNCSGSKLRKEGVCFNFSFSRSLSQLFDSSSNTLPASQRSKKLLQVN